MNFDCKNIFPITNKTSAVFVNHLPRQHCPALPSSLQTVSCYTFFFLFIFYLQTISGVLRFPAAITMIGSITHEHEHEQDTRACCSFSSSNLTKFLAHCLLIVGEVCAFYETF